MKRPRSALPLPRYVLRKPVKVGWSYFFNVPTWARKIDCPLKSEPLGRDYQVAVSRAETVLLPAELSMLRLTTTEGLMSELAAVADRFPALATPQARAYVDAVLSELRAPSDGE